MDASDLDEGSSIGGAEGAWHKHSGRFVELKRSGGQGETSEGGLSAAYHGEAGAVTVRPRPSEIWRQVGSRRRHKGRAARMVATLQEIRAMKDADVYSKFDQVAASTVDSLSFWTAEITRRDAAQTNQTIRRLTWAMAGMTTIIMIATLALLVRG